MGIGYDEARLLVRAHRKGANFERSVMVGRQFLLTSPRVLREAFRAERVSLSAPDAETICRSGNGFAEPLFTFLGATTVDSVDASDYEDATILHDMNEPLDPAVTGDFTLVFDGGSLEHIFSVAVAIENCMKLTAVGGTLLQSLPSNNNLGHGFYQFSPEFFHRTLSPENGFRVDELILTTGPIFSQWYSVDDSASVSQRVTLVFNRSSYVLVRSTRTEDRSLLQAKPSQATYSVAWDDQTESAPTDAGTPGWSDQPAWKEQSKLLARRLLAKTHRPLDRRFFHPID